jgi:hypothetical protein
MSESHGNLEVRPGAEIIAFPKPARAQPVTQAPPAAETPSEHLRRALAMLEAAQAEQRAALVKWRDAMAQLGTSATGLHDSLSTYQAQLAQIHFPDQ